MTTIFNDSVASTDIQLTTGVLQKSDTECTICGLPHKTEACPVLSDAQRVEDSKTPSRAHLTLPPTLRVHTLADGSTTVYAKTNFKRGTQFGPFQSKKTLIVNPAVRFPLKVFGPSDGDADAGYYLDSTNEAECNWMCLVSPATVPEEQNLICYQMKSDIYFSVMKDIETGEELKVWYAPYYAKKLGLPFVLQNRELNKRQSQMEKMYSCDSRECPKKKQKQNTTLSSKKATADLVSQLSPSKLGVKVAQEVWSCCLCGKKEGTVIKYAQHLQQHYQTRKCHKLKTVSCDSCLENFRTQKALQRHKRKTHKTDVQTSEIATGARDDKMCEASVTSIVITNVTGHAQEEDVTVSAPESSHMVFITSSGETVNEADFPKDGSATQKMVKMITHLLQSEHGHQNAEICVGMSDVKVSEETGERQKEANCKVNVIQELVNAEGTLTSGNPKIDSVCARVGKKELSPITVLESDASDTKSGPSSFVPVSDQDPSSATTTTSADVLIASQDQELGAGPDGTNTEVKEPMETEDTTAEFVPELVLLGPTYMCDICKKKFTKSEYLFRHLRKHTGEFTCPSCCRVFARNESLLTHNCPGIVRLGDPLAYFSCAFCSKVFSSEKMLKMHTAKHTGEFTCRSCHRSYSSKLSLDHHTCAKRKDELPTYVCHVCGKEFMRQVYLERHMPIHEGKHLCRVCGKWLRSPESLENHQQYCAQEKLFEESGKATCHHCESTYSSLQEYKQHVYEHTHPYPCKQCGVRFRSEVGLGIHVCEEEKYLECDICGKRFSTTSSLKRHELIHGEPMHHCFECGKSYHRAESLAKHPCEANKDTQGKRKKSQENALKKKKDAGVRHICDVCGASYASIFNLKIHMQLHGEKQWCCSLCEKRFHRKDLLQEHRTVHQQAQIPCPVCGKKVKTKKSLMTHLLLHQGIKRFQCDVCKKEFTQKGNMMKHRMIHEPPSANSLCCPYCGKKFRSKEYLNTHILEHTQGRIHECGICGKGFVKEYQLRSHLKLYHNSLMYICSYCGLSVRLRHSMRRHLEKQHEDWRNEWDTQNYIDNLLTTSVVGDGQVKIENLNETTAVAEADTQGSEILVTMDEVGTEELQRAIEEGRATITAGSVPDTIEISVPLVQQKGSGIEAQAGETRKQTSILAPAASVEVAFSQGHIQAVTEGAEIIGESSSEVVQAVAAVTQEEEVTLTESETYILPDGTVIQQDVGVHGNPADVLLYVLPKEGDSEMVAEAQVQIAETD